MKRLLVATSAAVAVVTSAAGVADAGPPANQGCYGESISALASNQPAPGAFGDAVVGFAQEPDSRPGVGDGVQLLQAGLVPDEVVPNTCND
jgi:peptidoglycan hydrolase-like protein with peptidoglycan-binding domain